MEADKDQKYPSHHINLSEGNPSSNNDFNSMFLENPHDEDHFHVHDHHVDNHDQHHHHQPSVAVDQEKRLRRRASNRESVRRSRMRERKKMEWLKMQVEQFMASNQFLTNSYISLLEYNHQILQENSQLKETVSSLLLQEYTIFHGEHDDDTQRFINGFDLNQQSPHQLT